MAKRLSPALLMVVLISGCANPADLQFAGVREIHVYKMDLSNISLGLDLDFYNPNKGKFQMKEMDLDVYLNDVFLGKAVQVADLHLPSRDSFLLPVKLDLSPSGAFSSLLSLGQKENKLKLEGSTKLGKGGIFVKRNISEVVNVNEKLKIQWD